MSIREALARKRVRRETFLLAVDDADAATGRLQEARQERVLAGIGKPDDDPAVVAAQAKVDRCQAEVDACYVPLVFQGIPAADFESLVASHPSKSDNDDLWDKDSLAPEIVAACLVDSDMTAEDWRAELSTWTRGDVDAVFTAAMRANIRPANVADQGKG